MKQQMLTRAALLGCFAALALQAQLQNPSSSPTEKDDAQSAKEKKENTGLPAIKSGELTLWLRADAGVTVDEEGYVSRWTDQSPSHNDASQKDQEKQPHLVKSAINGLPVLRFDGVQDPDVGDYLHGTKDAGMDAGFTSWLVYKRMDHSNGEKEPFDAGVPGHFNAIRGYYIRENTMAFTGWSNDADTGFKIEPGVYRSWCFRMNDENSELEFFDFDGSKATSFTNSVSRLETPGRGYYVGGLGSQTRNFKGDIAEIIVYRGKLNEKDRKVVENYLRRKYWNSTVPRSPADRPKKGTIES